MTGRVLHILSQRPGLTGSGVTLDAIVRQAAAAKWQQAVVVGVPASDPTPLVGGLPADAVHPVRFNDPPTGQSQAGVRADLPFAVPGMSDVMPYPSSVWSALTPAQLASYRTVWREHLARVIKTFQPDVIHSHHVWLVSALIKDIAPRLPVATTCHSTGLRQMELVPELGAEVRRGCARNDHFCVLRDDHGLSLRHSLQVGPERVTVVGAGYHPEIFHPEPGSDARATDLLYVGKYSRAKGLPWLLDAFSQMRQAQPPLQLHIAGGGSGLEADELRQRLDSLAPAVVQHGQLNQPELAALMRRCGVCVLPSFYEGVPLVLVEAAACGCQLVATDLPGVRESLAPHLDRRLQLVPLPGLTQVDRPVPADLPRFVQDMSAALAVALEQAKTPSLAPAPDLTPLTWRSVFERVASVWRGLMA